mmetsp:Transcript_17521/g.32967  ORF Transcript_17521/g.32967 Transcript_17521/m.32967 type:complete len:355 (-) Transcript_17521:8-1072(-)
MADAGEGEKSQDSLPTASLDSTAKDELPEVPKDEPALDSAGAEPKEEKQEAVKEQQLQIPAKDEPPIPMKQTAKTAFQRRAFPNLLAELGMKVTSKGVLLPESRKTQLRRRREARELAIASGQELQMIVPSAAAKRKAKNRADRKPAGVQLDDVESELFYGAHQGSVAACSSAVAKGADVNVRTKADLDGVGTGATALHVAAVRGHEDVVAALLRAGSDPLSVTGRGESPIQLATRMGHVDVVKVLRSSGGAPNHVEGVSQLLNKAPPSWRDTQRKKLRKALDSESRRPSDPPGNDRQALEVQQCVATAQAQQLEPADKGKSRGKGGKAQKRARSRKGKGKGKEDASVQSERRS